jgi:membrane-bound serine protease (ClpP class)
MSAAILALLILGPVLLVAEAHLPTYGVLGAGGVAAIALGMVLMVLASGGSIAVALALGLPVAAAGSALGVVALGKVRTAARRQARCGAEGLIGRVGVVRRPLEPLGQVAVDGALWRARRSWAAEDEPPPEQGEAVVVDRVQGLTLSVRRAESWEVDP